MYIFLTPPPLSSIGLNPVLLAKVDLGQNFPPAQQLLDAHFKKIILRKCLPIKLHSWLSIAPLFLTAQH